MTSLSRKPSDMWIDPGGFGDDDIEIIGQVGPSTSRHSGHVIPKRKKTTNGKIGPASKKCKVSGSGKLANEGNSFEDCLNWCLKYAPQTMGELVVTRDRPQKLMHILQDTTHAPGIVLMSGPSGCGKSTCLKLVCDNLGLDVFEYSSRVKVQHMHLMEEDTPPLGDWGTLSDISQENAFKNFLLQGGYKAFIQSTSNRSGKVLLVRDIPQNFVKEPFKFNKILSCYEKNGRCPLVFIMADTKDTQLNVNVLFGPNNLRADVTKMEFSGVSPTNMKKVLKTISQNENLIQITPPNLLKEIVETSGGDLRAAVTSLQMFWVQNHSKESPAQQQQAKDFNLNTFSALGKFIYSKRAEEPTKTQSKLPVHLLYHKRRNELSFDPEAVIARCGMPGDMFVLFLQQNYMQIYDMARVSIQNCAMVADILSLSDSSPAYWGARQTFEELYGASAVGRAIAHYHVKQGAATFTQYTMQGPKYLKVRKEIEKDRVLLKGAFGVGNKSLLCDMLPFMCRIPNCEDSDVQYDLACKLGKITISNKLVESSRTFRRSSNSKPFEQTGQLNIEQYMNDIQIDQFSDSD